MNKPKLPLRSALAALASSFADAVIAAARDAIFEMPRSQPFAHVQPQARHVRAIEPRRARAASAKRAGVARAKEAPPSPSPTVPASDAVAAPPVARATRGRGRPKGSRTAHDSAHASGPGELITDPQLLLAALDTAGPQGTSDTNNEPVRRAAPAILAPVTSVAPPAEAPPVRDFSPTLREGEVIVRRSAAGVVLRRRRA